MTVSDFMNSLESLGEHYPGSKRKRRAVTPPPPAEEDDRWDRRPVIISVDGQDHEFFAIGALAAALNRKPVTIRKWITEGVIPAARYRTTGNTIKGSRRLWTRAQIEGMRRIAGEEGILAGGNGANVSGSQFTARVRELFRVLKASEP